MEAQSEAAHHLLTFSTDLVEDTLCNFLGEQSGIFVQLCCKTFRLWMNRNFTKGKCVTSVKEVFFRRDEPETAVSSLLFSLYLPCPPPSDRVYFHAAEAGLLSVLDLLSKSKDKLPTYRLPSDEDWLRLSRERERGARRLTGEVEQRARGGGGNGDGDAFGVSADGKREGGGQTNPCTVELVRRRNNLLSLWTGAASGGHCGVLEAFPVSAPQDGGLDVLTDLAMSAVMGGRVEFLRLLRDRHEVVLQLDFGSAFPHDWQVARAVSRETWRACRDEGLVLCEDFEKGLISALLGELRGPSLVEFLEEHLGDCRSPLAPERARLLLCFPLASEDLEVASAIWEWLKQRMGDPSEEGEEVGEETFSFFRSVVAASHPSEWDAEFSPVVAAAWHGCRKSIEWLCARRPRFEWHPNLPEQVVLSGHFMTFRDCTHLGPFLKSKGGAVVRAACMSGNFSVFEALMEQEPRMRFRAFCFIWAARAKQWELVRSLRGLQREKPNKVAPCDEIIPELLRLAARQNIPAVLRWLCGEFVTHTDLTTDLLPDAAMPLLWGEEGGIEIRGEGGGDRRVSAESGASPGPYMGTPFFLSNAGSPAASPPSMALTHAPPFGDLPYFPLARTARRSSLEIVRALHPDTDPTVEECEAAATGENWDALLFLLEVGGTSLKRRFVERRVLERGGGLLPHSLQCRHMLQEGMDSSGPLEGGGFIRWFLELLEKADEFVRLGAVLMDQLEDLSRNPPSPSPSSPPSSRSPNPPREREAAFSEEAEALLGALPLCLSPSFSPSSASSSAAAAASASKTASARDFAEGLVNHSSVKSEEKDNVRVEECMDKMQEDGFRDCPFLQERVGDVRLRLESLLTRWGSIHIE
uniref:Uncharacterized protein n=1 Tax=Chromera velia CCMP2878 TaxID=1169474 RepID=A0A0G4IC09_9ALVE|eukprot:Cvel_13009.t1-p1 / transcript=Cvel_13009.t1 / gene=Cvel_13009 / organism=Chromera_velia_CCMP2878 / gene_product=hypothetical protein / transcript_product=hypothetical protein / location=Cvel_scaffold873:11647-14618(-) / protein_length=865 / sequence_SO=supercontig / SO=protein_coding / is_pseudo=false